MKIEMMALNKITRYPGNPRRNVHAVPGVRRSIEEFGWRQPIVVDKKHVIIVGDTRYLAAVAMGLKQVPVHVAADLSEEKANAYRIADNNVGGEWDNAKLMIEIARLNDANPEFDATLLGFSKEELDKMQKDSYQPRELEDFEKSPVEGTHWILMRAPESQCALALGAIKKLKLKDAHVEYSRDK